jgi:hypothetical protein
VFLALELRMPIGRAAGGGNSRQELIYTEWYLPLKTERP